MAANGTRRNVKRLGSARIRTVQRGNIKGAQRI
jgi:hypothetical protein